MHSILLREQPNFLPLRGPVLLVRLDYFGLRLSSDLGHLRIPTSVCWFSQHTDGFSHISPVFASNFPLLGLQGHVLCFVMEAIAKDEIAYEFICNEYSVQLCSMKIDQSFSLILIGIVCLWAKKFNATACYLSSQATPLVCTNSL